jgi:hypothetical protein
MIPLSENLPIVIFPWPSCRDVHNKNIAMEIGFSSAGISLRGLGLARIKFHRLSRLQKK